MRSSARFLVACATILSCVPIVGVSSSHAQCIVGPTEVCPGDSIQLCAPAVSGVSYLWQDPDGTLYMTDCIFAFKPGLYTLRMRDVITRTWLPPCSLDVQSGRSSAPVIQGPVSTCAGVPVDWCGPSGNFEYAWNGPNGFQANTECVSIAAAGDYFLQVRAIPAGCWGDSSLRSLAVSSCQPGVANCPRPAWWWAANGSDRDRRRDRLDRSQIATVASCVDASAEALDWPDDAAGFIGTLAHDRHKLRMRARRQFAAVWANVCAGQLGVTPRDGSSLGLDPATKLDASLGGGTIGSWLAFADGELARLQNARDGNRSVREAYRDLIRTGWHINHGRKIGTTCRTDEDASDDLKTATEAGMAATEGEVEPLESELNDGDQQGALGAIEPNPFSTQTSVAFTVSSGTAVMVSISVYDVSGRVVRELARSPYGPGQHLVRWDGSGDDGARVRSGLYFIRGRIGDDPVDSRVCLVR